MLDHYVFPVVRVARHEISVHDFPIGNGANFIERLAICVAMHGANVNSFVEAGIDSAT